MENKISGHTYIYNGVRYNNMKEACEGIGVRSKAFKFLVKNGLAIKESL